MRRFYLLLAADLLVVASPMSAQTPATHPKLGSTFTVPVLADLPTGGSLYSILDTMPAEVISDRIDTGGLFTGESARVGSHGSSWTQTMFRLGDVDITNPDGSGTPMLVPGLLAWNQVEITTGLMPIEVNAPGMAVSLTPRMPSASWMGTVQFMGAGPSLLARQANTIPPAIAHQQSWYDGSVLVSGPLVPNRVGIVFAGSFTSSTRLEREPSTLLDAQAVSMFTHVVVTPNPSDSVRVVAWADRNAFPYANRIAFAQPLASETADAAHGQVTWERRMTNAAVAAVFGSFGRRRQTNTLQPSSILVVERLRDGPVPELINPMNGSTRTWSLGARMASAPLAFFNRPHALRGGAVWSAGDVTARSTFSGRIGELVAGVPARIWQYSSSGAESTWANTLLAVYVADTFQIHPRLTLDAGIRFEALHGSADGSASRIAWQNWLPRGSLRWELTSYAKIAAVAGFARYGDRLPLETFAYGDPKAPVASIYRWNATGDDPELRSAGPLVARVGPGTGGDDGFSAIDSNIVRPYMDEFIAGFESRPRAGTVIRLAGLARREKRVLGVLDVGAPESAYAVTLMTDPGEDHAAGQLLPVYNRLPSTFGSDRYFLTNPPDNEATFVGLELTMQATFDRFFLLAGATAGRSEGLSANVGFRANENDHGVLGEVFVDPNSRTYAQGRVFSERGYTIKAAGVWTLPWDVRLGYAARYQDGQHFARVVIVPDLNQGTAQIRAFRNGKTRFTFTATLDGRLQKSFTVGRQRLAILFDAYNILNKATEVEEFSVTGPESRLTSAVQPPRAVHLGLRLTF